MTKRSSTSAIYCLTAINYITRVPIICQELSLKSFWIVYVLCVGMFYEIRAGKPTGRELPKAEVLVLDGDEDYSYHIAVENCTFAV